MARIIGYDSIPTTMLSSPIPHGRPQPAQLLRERVKDILAAAGMRETISYSLVSRDMLRNIGAAAEERDALRIANPMSGEFTHLRTSLRASVLATLANNRRISQSEGIRIYEIGNVYLPKEEALERDLPEEREMLVGVVSGARFPASWNAPSGEMGFFDAKGLLEALFGELRVSVSYEAYADDAILQAGRTARLLCNGAGIGTVGEVSRAALERFHIDDHIAALFEVDLDALHAALPQDAYQHRAASRYPEAYRDLALIVDADVTSARIQAIIARHKMAVRSVPFDIYEGEGVPAGKRSLAYRIVFQSERGTLTIQASGQIPIRHPAPTPTRTRRRTARIAAMLLAIALDGYERGNKWQPPQGL